MKAKKRIMILFCICVVVLIAAVIIDKNYNKEYFIELNYQQVLNKFEKKDSFVLCLSQTSCEHCAKFKPRLQEVANEYKKEIYYVETDLFTEEQSEAFKKLIAFSGTPTTVFITEGEEKTAANRINGEVSTEKIVKKLKNNGIIK